MSQPIANRWNLPDLGMGLGLRGKHIPTILRQRPPVGWFEVISDNALIHAGWLQHALDQLAERYPLVLHGVTLNLGSTDALDIDYLKGIKALADRWQVPWVSDHLCWTGIDGRQSHDLLPVPYSEEMLAWMTRRIRLVQDVLERPLIVENPSSYLQFHATSMPEWQFLSRLAQDADCGLLLDVNNVYVAAQNHGFAWQDYLAAMPWDRVVQMHVAGHTTYETHLFDSHIGPVDAPVWDVLTAAYAACGGRSLLLEWDFAIPSFAQTWREAKAAWQRVAPLQRVKPLAPRVPKPRPMSPQLGSAPQSAALMRWMLDAVTERPTERAPDAWIAQGGRLTPDARVAIHRQMYAARCDDALAEDFPLLLRRLGKTRFRTLAAAYRHAVPSTSWALELFGAQLPEWLETQPQWPSDAADLARLDRAQVRALLAPESPPLDPALLAKLDPTDHAHLVLRFAPATQLLQLKHSALPRHAGPQAWLVTRRVWRVARRLLDPHEAELLRLLADRVALGPAVEALLAAHPDHADALAAAVGPWFAAWAQAGAVAGWEVV